MEEESWTSILRDHMCVKQDSCCSSKRTTVQCSLATLRHMRVGGFTSLIEISFEG